MRADALPLELTSVRGHGRVKPFLCPLAHGRVDEHGLWSCIDTTGDLSAWVSMACPGLGLALMPSPMMSSHSLPVPLLPGVTVTRCFDRLHVVSIQDNVRAPRELSKRGPKPIALQSIPSYTSSMCKVSVATHHRPDTPPLPGFEGPAKSHERGVPSDQDQNGKRSTPEWISLGDGISRLS